MMARLRLWQRPSSVLNQFLGPDRKSMSVGGVKSLFTAPAFERTSGHPVVIVDVRIGGLIALRVIFVCSACILILHMADAGAPIQVRFCPSMLRVFALRLQPFPLHPCPYRHSHLVSPHHLPTLGSHPTRCRRRCGHNARRSSALPRL